MYIDKQKQKKAMEAIHERFEKRKREETEKYIAERKVLEKQVKEYIYGLTATEMRSFVHHAIVLKQKIRFDD